MGRLNKDQKRKKKLAERERRRNQPKFIVKGPCVECGEPVYAHQEYVVKDETWAEAGMEGWASGLLHIQCLTKRLGRKLEPEELLCWPVSLPGPDGSFEASARPDYLKRPEFLDHH
jgi:hypothetical protein